MSDARCVLPLSTVDDLREALSETNVSLAGLESGRVVDRGRLEERRRILVWWRDRLESQLAEMEVAA